MKKNGFTLAEVLVTLGIVGIIAAITLPSLLLNVEKQKVGPAFMKAINTLESASTFAIRDNEVRGLSDIKADANLLGDVLTKYTKLSLVATAVNSNIESENPILNIFIDLANTMSSAYISKDGIAFFGGTYDASKDAYPILIDLNGGMRKGPNLPGIDLFKVYVLNNGTVAVSGTKKYQDFIEATAGHWKTSCRSVATGDSNPAAPTDPNTCGGSILENGGRVLYAYDKIKRSN